METSENICGLILCLILSMSTSLASLVYTIQDLEKAKKYCCSNIYNFIHFDAFIAFS